MKQYLSLALVAVSILLAVALLVIKHGDQAQMDKDAGTITDYSNHLDTAQAQVAAREGSLLTLSNTLAETSLTLSNRLDESLSASLTLSNHLIEAESTIVLDTEQITNLNRHVAEMESENQTLGRRVMDLTNQVAALSQRIALTEASLTQTNQDLVQARKDYALLDNRFRRDVAERVVVERRFNTLAEVQAQEQKLQKQGAPWVTPQSIYAGLEVEVKSNGVAHVISPD